jgi:hypothetical protein
MFNNADNLSGFTLFFECSYLNNIYAPRDSGEGRSYRVRNKYLENSDEKCGIFRIMAELFTTGPFR